MSRRRLRGIPGSPALRGHGRTTTLKGLRWPFEAGCLPWGLQPQAVGGTYAPWQRELYGFMVEYHTQLLSRIRPGVTAAAILEEAASAMREVVERTAFSKPAYERAARRRRHYTDIKEHGTYIMRNMKLNEGAVEAIRRRQTTPGMVADVLRDAIMHGELKGGQALRQDELAARFGLSRIPVREALRQLEGEGLVVVHPHRGAVVSVLSGEELQELCEIRIALETAALRRALTRMDDETLRRAEEILAETDRAASVLDIWSKNNWRFHATLYRPAQRPRLLDMIKTLHDTIDRYLRLHVSLLHYKDRGQSEHWNLLAACRRRDADLAVTLLEQHVEGVAVLLAEYLAPGEAPDPSAPNDEASARAGDASPATGSPATGTRGRRTTRTPYIVKADG